MCRGASRASPCLIGGSRRRCSASCAPRPVRSSPAVVAVYFLWFPHTSSCPSLLEPLPRARRRGRVRLRHSRDATDASDITSLPRARVRALCRGRRTRGQRPRAASTRCARALASAPLARDPRSDRGCGSRGGSSTHVTDQAPANLRLDSTQHSAHRLRWHPRVVRRVGVRQPDTSARCWRSRSCSISAGGCAPGSRPPRTRSRGRRAHRVVGRPGVYARCARGCRCVPLPVGRRGLHRARAVPPAPTLVCRS